MRKIIITESQFDYWKEQNRVPAYFGKKAYHVVGGKISSNVIDAARSVYRNGLVPSDNGEVGNVVWFFVDKPFYENYSLMFSIDITPENYEKFEMNVDEPSMWVHKTIPFEYLNVECAPMLLLDSGYVLPNKINRIITNGFANNFENWMPEAKPVTVFTDVAPKELLNQLDPNSPNVKFDKLFR